MAITQNKGNGSGRKIVYFNLAVATNNHLAAEQAAKNPDYKEAGFMYKDAANGNAQTLVPSLTGHVVRVVVKREFDKFANRDVDVASVRLADDDNVDEIISFKLNNSLGIDLIGKLAASALVHKDPIVDIYASRVQAGEKIGEATFNSARSFVNIKPAGAPTTERFRAIFANEQGDIVSFKNEKGEDAPLPPAKKVMFQGKEILDFFEHEQLAGYTARCLEAYYKRVDAPAETETGNENDGDGIDLAEAAQAAAPRG